MTGGGAGAGGVAAAPAGSAGRAVPLTAVDPVRRLFDVGDRPARNGVPLDPSVLAAATDAGAEHTSETSGDTPADEPDEEASSDDEQVLVLA